jgi:hypothetical protein
MDRWNVAASVGVCLVALMACALFCPVLHMLAAASADALEGQIFTPKVR